ncbi:MAG TPA: hypothetical protein VLA77_01895 [Candidatus Saccharimonadales bacterium]|nr:hypothetical protein [Candidatus Saccharimonadales bacterium]
MKTIFFTKNYKPHNWDIAHLYEHIVIANLEDTLAKKGFVPDIDFFIFANTFSGHLIKLSFVFYDDNTISVFKESLKNLQPPEDVQITAAIKEVEAEDACRINFEIDALKDALNKLYNNDWQKTSNFKDPQDADHENLDYYKFIPALENFNGLRIKIKLPKTAYGQNDENLAIFTRLSVILADTISRELRKKTYAYCKMSDTLQEKESTTVTAGYLISKTFSKKEVLKLARESITQKKLHPKYKQIKNHIAVWAKNYKHGFDKDKIIELLNSRTLDLLLSSIKIDVSLSKPTQDEIKRWREINSDQSE